MDERSHVIPALIKRMHNAKINKDPKVKVWGDGRPKENFYMLMIVQKLYKILLDSKYYKLVNIGTNEDITTLKI